MGQCWMKTYNYNNWGFGLISNMKMKKNKKKWCNRGDVAGGEDDEEEEAEEDPFHETADGNVHLVTTIDKWEEKMREAIRDSKPVVVNFSTGWCRPCRTMTRIYLRIANKHSSSLIFLTVDVDALAEFSNSWDIKATPTFLFLKNGREVDKLVGSNKAKLAEKTNNLSNTNNNKST